MKNDNTVVWTVSSPCGSGKTYSTCKYIAERKNYRNYLYVAPSIKLLDQTKRDFEAAGLKVDMITSDNASGQVVATVTRYMASAEKCGHVLLITWATYKLLPFFENRGNWRVIIDEVPQVDKFYSYNFRNHMDVLLKHVQIGEAINATLATVIPVNPDGLKRLLENPDDITKFLRPFLSDVLSPTTDVFVDSVTWAKFAEYQDFGKKGSKPSIFFMSMLNPTLFDYATILGANIEDSLLYKWLSQFHAAEFKTNTVIAKKLRYTEHPESIGKRLKINYLLKGKGYSKHLANKQLKESEYRWIDGLDKAALNFINHREFLYAVNADYTGILSTTTNGTQIPVISHGINEYMDHDILYFPVSLNRAPIHLKMLNQLGLANEDVKNATLNEVVYQALMRTALRDLGSEKVVECIVPEYATACALASAFGTAELKWIGSGEYEEAVAMTGSERNRKAKAKKRLHRIMPEFNDEYHKIYQEYRHEKMANQGSGCAPLYAVTYHADIYEKDVDDFYLDYYEPKEFVSELRSLSKDEIEDKTSTYMINSTVFEKRNEDDKGFRCQANFLESSMLILDFDNGTLSVNDFIRIFWEKAGRGNKHSFLIFNSFSRSEAQPNRFRVVMLYKKTAYSLDAHQAVYDSIVNRIEANGFDAKSSGLDNACRTGNQSFYIPCTNAAHPEWAFFKAYGCTTRDIERHGIDPELFLRTAIKPSSEQKVVKISGKSKAVPKSSIDEWKTSINTMVNGRRRTVFDFAYALANQYDLPRGDVESHLYDLNMDENIQSHIESALAYLNGKSHWKAVA